MFTSRYFAIQRLKVFLEELERLESSTFPYTHSLDALEILRVNVIKHIENLESLDATSGPLVVDAACNTATALLQSYLPYAGFFLRSTNVRNAFEVYGPVLRIARQVLGPHTKLVLSSEWEFSPYTYIDNTSFNDFVLIGLPASESSNPLLLPTAGHELGHTIWNERIDRITYFKRITDAVLEHIRATWSDYKKNYPEISAPKSELGSDIFAQRTWAPARDSAFKQAEEIFCDFIGIRIFGESYLYAFAYLVAPGSAYRSPIYPLDQIRARYLMRAMQKYGTAPPPNYDSLFTQSVARTDYIQNAADSAVEKVIDELLVDADSILLAANVPCPDPVKTLEIYELYKRLAVPARASILLSNILNAAWRAYLDPQLWDELPQISDKSFVLKELVLKNIEVLEIESRLQANI